MIDTTWNDRLPGCPNFTWKEVTKNGTRPIQDSVQGGRKISAYEVENNAIKIGSWLQRLRNTLEERANGRSPAIHVTSWFRPPEVNRAVGGVPSSYHLTGGAVDFYLDGWAPEEVLDALLDLKFPGGIGVNVANKGWFIHIDIGKSRAWNYNNSPRSQKLLAFVKRRLGQW